MTDEKWLEGLEIAKREMLSTIYEFDYFGSQAQSKASNIVDFVRDTLSVYGWGNHANRLSGYAFDELSKNGYLWVSYTGHIFLTHKGLEEGRKNY